MEFFRLQGTITCAEAKALPTARRIRASGVTVNIHKPPTRSGKTVVFLNLSDETGIIDVVLFEDIYKRDGAELFNGGIVVIEGGMCSSGHRSNIMEGDFDDMGTGVESQYYTQDFGGGASLPNSRR